MKMSVRYLHQSSGLMLGPLDRVIGISVTYQL